MFNFPVDAHRCIVGVRKRRDIVTHGTGCGVSAIWIFANLSFTGMQAQATGSSFWKVVTFIFGFPGTLVTLLAVEKGSERAYGIDMQRKQATR